MKQIGEVVNDNDTGDNDGDNSNETDRSSC